MSRWFSAALDAVRSLQPKGDPTQMINTLRKQPGVKKEEMDFLRLDELFDGEKVVTVADLQEAIMTRLRETGLADFSASGNEKIFQWPRSKNTPTYSAMELYEPNIGTRRQGYGTPENPTLNEAAYPHYSYLIRGHGGVLKDLRKETLAQGGYIERIPRAGKSDLAYDYDNAGQHFPQSTGRDGMFLNIGHTRGFTGDLVQPNQATALDSDGFEVAIPNKRDPIFVLDEVQSDLMQDANKQRKKLKEIEDRIASEVSQAEPNVEFALNERWKNEELKDLEVQAVIDKLFENGTFQIVDQPDGNVQIISDITGRSLGFGTEREAREQVANFVETAMLPQSPYSDNIVHLFPDGFKDPGPIEEIIGELDYGNSPLQQIMREQAEVEAARKGLPFQKSWPDLLLKDALQEAVDRDVPYFGWMDADQQTFNYGPMLRPGMEAFYDNRLVNSKVFKELGLDKPQRGQISRKGDKRFDGDGGFDNAWFVKLPPEVRKRIREQGLPLFSLGALTAFGPYENQGALYD